MTESYYTQLVVKALKQQRPGNMVFKLADLYTMGVPDVMMNIGGVSTFFEAKKLSSVIERNGKFYAILRPKEDIPAVQWETLRRLVRGHLLIYTDHGHSLTHVNGQRESVSSLQLELMDLKTLVKRIIVIAEQS